MQIYGVSPTDCTFLVHLDSSQWTDAHLSVAFTAADAADRPVRFRPRMSDYSWCASASSNERTISHRIDFLGS